MSPILHQTLMIAAAFFVLGTIGFLTRRNLILMFLSLELMLAGVSMNFLAFGYHYGILSGQIMAILILTVASCEAGLALALVVTLFRRQPTLDVAQWSGLGEVNSRVLVIPSDDPAAIQPADDAFPDLSVAGPLPSLLPSPVRHLNDSQKA